jgi:hypothetical protein
MVRFDDLVEDPTEDEEKEDAIVMDEAGKDGKDDEMNDSLGILTVVHGAHAGNEAQESGQTGIRLTVVGWRDGGTIGGCAGISTPTR